MAEISEMTYTVISQTIASESCRIRSAVVLKKVKE